MADEIKLPESVEAAFRLFTENAQHQHTHGCLVGTPCKEAERVRRAIAAALKDASEPIGLCPHGFLKCFYCWRDAGFPAADDPR